MQSGELIDVSSLLSAWGEVAIPERVIPEIKKILWKDIPPQHVITIDNRDAFVQYGITSGHIICTCTISEA